MAGNVFWKTYFEVDRNFAEHPDHSNLLDLPKQPDADYLSEI